METFIYIAKSASVLTLFYLVYFIVLRKDTFFSTNRYFLVGGIMASLLLPFLVFTKTVYKDAPISNTFISYNNNNPVIEAQSFSIDWWELILVIYLIGVLFMSLRFLKQIISLYSLIKNNSYSEINGFRHIQLKENINPFSFFKYIVYNPKKHTESDLKMILKHEQSHAFQLHSIDIILSNILLIIHWINPIAWFYKKRMEENLEFIADSETVQQILSKKAYQLSMLKVFSSNTLQPVLANNFYQSLIKKRIIMLHKNQSSTKNQWKLLLILPLLGFFLWSFNIEEEIKYNDYSLVIPEIEIAAEIPSIKEEISFPKVSENKIKSESKKDIAIISEKKNNQSIDNKITVTVDKNTSDAELDKLTALFKNTYAVTLKFTGVKRNSAGEITKIKVSMNSKKSTANFNQDDSDGINEFSISYDSENDSISMGSHNNHDLHIISKEGHGHGFKYKIKEDGDNVHIFSGSDKNSDVWITKDGNHIKKGSHSVIIESDDDDSNNNVFIFKSNDREEDDDSIFIHKEDDKGFFFVDSNDKDLLIYIDGKKSSKKEMEKLDSDAIDSIEIIKGDKAIEKYGKKAKDGVLLITTKKK